MYLQWHGEGGGWERGGDGFRASRGMADGPFQKLRGLVGRRAFWEEDCMELGSDMALRLHMSKRGSLVPTSKPRHTHSFTPGHKTNPPCFGLP